MGAPVFVQGTHLTVLFPQVLAKGLQATVAVTVVSATDFVVDSVG